MTTSYRKHVEAPYALQKSPTDVIRVTECCITHTHGYLGRIFQSRASPQVVSSRNQLRRKCSVDTNWKRFL